MTKIIENTQHFLEMRQACRVGAVYVPTMSAPESNIWWAQATYLPYVVILQR